MLPEQIADSRDGAVRELSAPARVNLLGEHTDYTGGLVMPMAIPFYTQAKIRPAADSTYRFRSVTFPGERAMDTADRSGKTGKWSDYPVGVLRELEKLGLEPPAFELELSGNVPFGAGVSSSASVEVASCLAMMSLSGKWLSGAEIALLCQRAENQYVGSPCGIMDQFVITNAQAGHALLLNTRELTFELIPMNAGGFKDVVVVVCNSMVKHSIAAGGYGDRRKQVEEGQAVLRKKFETATDLAHATTDQLESAKTEMSHEAYLRCRHIITENARVREAKQAMLLGNPVAMGKLMVAAHASQRDDFECSCDEIDYLVDTAVNLPGCYGARMTGGGFGGCTVNLVVREQVEGFIAALTGAYQAKFGITAETYVCEAVDGALARSGVAANAAAKEKA